MKLKRKSPWLAGLLSTIIPGSGKIYAGRWKDGLIALFMTSSTAFVSIKGFQNDHHKFYPWALGTIAAVYYSGNIYGSSQAAKKYNEGKEDALSQKAYDYILSDN